jgi:voltage-gated potassium channel
MNSQRKSGRQIRVSVLIFFSIVIIGTAGYMIIEEWSFSDAVYMTFISITTTGFREVRPLSDIGRVFTIFIISGGFISILYIAGRAAQFLIQFYMNQRRKMKRKISNLRNHYIVCGYGRMGRVVIDGLMEAKIPFVIIEKNKDLSETLIEGNILHIKGDATEDAVLESAGVARAKGLVTVLPTDAENVFTTLSARGLNRELFIVSRAVASETEEKLLKAGANRVVKPLEIAASRLVHLLLRPGVMDFIDLVVHGTSIDLKIEEIQIRNRSPMIDRKISEFINRRDLNMLVIGIYRADGSFIYNPTAEDVIQEGDKLIAMGKRNDFKTLRELCRAT